MRCYGNPELRGRSAVPIMHLLTPIRLFFGGQKLEGPLDAIVQRFTSSWLLAVYGMRCISNARILLLAALAYFKVWRRVCFPRWCGWAARLWS